ncbi:MAG: porin family protein [Candidatus Eisenbacteria bacterium]
MRQLVAALALALVLVASQAFAATAGTGYGIKGGLSIASVHGDDVESPDSRIVGCFGGFIEIPINEMISFQPELLYAMKGAKYTEGDREWTWKLTYIEIPMLFKINIPTSGAIDPFVAAGPEVAFKVSSKVEASDQLITIELDDEDVKGTDLGIIIGGGIGFPMMNHRAMLEARYDLGLTTIDNSAWEADVKNNVISVLVGVAF